MDDKTIHPNMSIFIQIDGYVTTLLWLFCILLAMKWMKEWQNMNCCSFSALDFRNELPGEKIKSKKQ